MVQMRMTRILPIFALCLASSALLPAQRDRAPRRLENPEDLQLPGGSRLEFRSFRSSALDKDASYSILTPPSYDKEPERRFPVIYFLHGLNNDHTSWATPRYGNLPLQVETFLKKGKTPEFLLVHPDGENSLYTDSLDGTGEYETYIRRDLTSEVEKNFRVQTGRSGRALGGVSMGGYGALKIAMRHPKEFASASGTSPIVFLGEDPSNSLTNRESRRGGYVLRLIGRTFGDPFNREHWRENSLETLARTAPLDQLNIHFSYGTADRYNRMFPMEQGVKTLDQILSERGIAHTCQIYEDEPHGWELVRSHLDETLAFLSQTFSHP